MGKGRIKSIEKAVDSVITLFPFEEDAYKHSNIRICYAGHPLAYRLDQDFEELIKGKQAKSIALLPGSRKSEISLLANDMIRAARELKRKDKYYQFYMPLSDERHLELIKEPMEALSSCVSEVLFFALLSKNSEDQPSTSGSKSWLSYQ